MSSSNRNDGDRNDEEVPKKDAPLKSPNINREKKTTVGKEDLPIFENQTPDTDLGWKAPKKTYDKNVGTGEGETQSQVRGSPKMDSPKGSPKIGGSSSPSAFSKFSRQGPNAKKPTSGGTDSGPKHKP